MRPDRTAAVVLAVVGVVQAQYTRSMRSRSRNLTIRQEGEGGSDASTGGEEDAGEGEGDWEGEESGDTSVQGGGGGGGGSNDLYLISHEDFCIYGPREAGKEIASVGQDVVSWCTTGEHGGKVIPEGALSGVTYVKTPNYVQVSGTGDFTRLNLAASDRGGQLDSSEHTPDGAQLFIQDNQAVSSWVTVIDPKTFCVRACTGDPQYCPTQYDEMGCWFITSNGVGWPDVYQDCEGEDGDIPGVQDGQTFTPGSGATPTPAIPAVWNCQAGSRAPAGGATANAASTVSASGSSSGSGSGSHGDPSSTSHGGPGGRSGASASASASGSGSGSGSMIPVETCVPCAGAGAGSTSGSGSGSGSAAGTADAAGSAPASSTGGAVSTGTIEVGMGPMTSDGGSLSVAGSAAAPSGSGSGSASGGGDLLQARQVSASSSGAGSAAPTGAANDISGNEDSSDGTDGTMGGGDAGSMSSAAGVTVTKGDQCCFTTYTHAGGAAPTGTGAAGGLSAGASGSATHPYHSMSGTANGSSATGGVAGGNHSGNGTAGDSGAMAAIGLNSASSGAVSLVVALLIVGGWTLL